MPRPGVRAARQRCQAGSLVSREPQPAPGPTYMPQYHLADSDKSTTLDATADAHTQLGEAAGSIGGNYVRITVVLAGVLS